MKPRPIPPLAARVAKPEPELANIQYLVWDTDHSAWWDPDASGYNDYTQVTSKAARFSLIEATTICTEANRGSPNNPVKAMVPIARGA